MIGSNRKAAVQAEVASKERDSGIDAFRYAMALLVICLHILPPAAVSPSTPFGLPSWAVVVDILCRCAVPFFFITSGYYFRPERGVWFNIKSKVIRIAPIYLVWYLIFIGVALLVPGKMPEHWRIINLVDGGPGFHLWFLPALIFGLITLTLTLALGGRTLAIAITVLFAVAGPFLAEYHSLVGIVRYPHHLDDFKRQLAAPAFVTFGYLLRGSRPTNLPLALSLSAVAICAMFIERYTLAVFIGSTTANPAESLFSVFAYGASLFNLSRSLNKYPVASFIGSLGKLSLAVYLLHLLLVWIFQRTLYPSLSQFLTLGTIVAVSSTILALLAVRMPLIRRFVS